ncbi:MAG: hypothetical protein WDA12_02665 [Bacilli bacterium]
MAMMIPKALRSIVAWLDTLVYGIIGTIYDLFLMISQTNPFTSETIEIFGSRIYSLLGIIMLFKLSFSLINYIINPSEMTDKSKGGSKMIMNVMIVLLLIVSTPSIFKAIFEFQAIVLQENIIGQVILGVGGDSTKDSYKRAGQIMSFDVFIAFYKPDIGECEGNYMFKDAATGELELESGCLNALNAIDTNINAGNQYKKALQNKSMKILLESDLLHLTKPNENKFVFDYTAWISTFAGGFVAWILLVFCIDIAIRSVKLGFYQLIAPIPIVSYIDPNSGKSGMFRKWVKSTTTTFLDVFIRLAAVFFAIFIISNLDNMEYYDAASQQMVQQSNLFVKIFIIFGALLFAKQLPKIIKDLTGLDLDGGFTLNPMKKLGASPLASAAIGGVAGGIGAMGANLVAGVAGGKGIGGTALSMAGGAFSGAGRGVMGGLKSGGKGSAIDSARTAITGSNQARNRHSTIRELNAANPDSKITLANRYVQEPINRWAGVKNRDAGMGELDKQSKMLTKEMADYDQQENAYRMEYAQATSAGLKTGIYSLDDFDFAQEKIDITRNINGQQVTSKGYDFDVYKQRVEQENRTLPPEKKIEVLDRVTYGEITGITGAIENINDRREKLRQQKGRIDDAIKERKSLGERGKKDGK